ncbi:hypothetical protein SAMN05444360_12630 [Chryseobacterium carnipullorum]|jgi:hypothetical protein|uniref:hypothetical protein n=1 Tax=Chryseobacterium TaxID=59732 RepID=UPI0009193120|nr:hypothetical protein [Chryseobacterium carnipullorum]SHN00959.1 hypothetical protein SAMN05444360_12630 [Chryseobacterium carnipullorum]
MKKNFLDKIKAIENIDSKEHKISADKNIIYYDGNKPKNVIKTFEAGKDKPEYVNLSNLLYNDIFKDSLDLINAPIEAIRVIFILIHQSKSVSFNQPRAPYTPSLFEEEFLTKDNTFASFDIPTGLISPSRDTKRIEKALLLLMQNTIRSVVSKNSKNEDVKSLISFIEKPKFTRGRVYLEVSSYWLEKMANIEHYNPIIFDLAYNIPNTQHIFFAIWLRSIPMYQEAVFKKETYKSWTQINIDTLRQKFGLDGKDRDYISEKFLKPIQAKLFEFNDRSFAFQYDKGSYYITALDVKSNKVIGNLKPENTYKVKVKYSINYLQRRHKVDKDSLEHIETIYLNSVLDKELMEDAYNNLKKVIKKEEMKMTDITGLKFLARWQEEIQKSYEKTSNFKNFPKGYPKVITSE